MTKRNVIAKSLATLVLLALPFFFQNCGQAFQAGTCLDADCSTIDQASLQPKMECEFNGEVLQHGDSVSAARDAYSTNCAQISQTRVCENGILSGNYQYASCTSNINEKPCLYDGRTILHNGTVKAFAASSVAASETCQEETRTCVDGNLSGSYTFSRCAVNAPRDCSFEGKTVAHAAYVTAFLNSTEPASGSCKSEKRYCNDGRLTGSYGFGSCTLNAPRACSFNNTTVPHGGSVNAFAKGSVPYSQTCTYETRTCNDGVLSGSAAFATCAANAPNPCSFNGASVAHNASVTAFKESSVPFANACVQEARVCNNGVLSGSHQYASCVKDAPRACLVNGRTYAHGASGTFAKAATVAYGSSCEYETRYCSDGAMSGTATFDTCSVAAAASCNFNGTIVPHGQSVAAYQTYSSGASACILEGRSCSNGTLSGNAPHATCAASGRSCAIGGGETIPHGSASKTLYHHSTAPANTGFYLRGGYYDCTDSRLAKSSHYYANAYSEVDYSQMRTTVTRRPGCLIMIRGTNTGKKPYYMFLEIGQKLYGIQAQYNSCRPMNVTCARDMGISLEDPVHNTIPASYIQAFTDVWAPSCDNFYQ